MMRLKLTQTLMALAISSVLTGCMATNPVLGGSKGNAVTGAAGGASSQGENKALEKCDEPLGTLGVVENQSDNWYSTYRSRLPSLGSTVPVLRLLIQQSNCFIVVERGNTMKNLNSERALANSGELREGSNMGKGQMVAADYTMAPSIQFAEKGTGGVGGLVAGRLLGSLGGLIAGGMKKNEAATTLLLIDNRSSIQVSASVGSAKNYDLKLFGGFFGGGFAGAGAFGNTPEGKLLTAAFTDSYNQMVKSLRTYEAQEIKGGAGKGGKLGVSN